MRALPAGELLRLDPTLDLDTFDLTPFQRKVAEALQVYGAYNADTTPTGAIQEEPS